MNAFGLPDVSGDERRAVHAAAMHMIFENVTLANDETFTVDDATYTVRSHGDWLHLER